MITLVLGRREQGKSTIALHVTRKAPTRIIFDPRGMFHSTSDVIPDALELLEMLDDRAEIIVQPESDVPGSLEQVCASLRYWLRENPEEEVTLLIDEARFAETASSIPPSLDYILRMAPRDLVHVVMTAHRPQDISVDIRAIADFWIIFRVTQEHDLEVIRKRCGEEVAEIVANLKDREVVVWNDGRASWRKQSNPSQWYVPLGLPVMAVPQAARVIA